MSSDQHPHPQHGEQAVAGAAAELANSSTRYAMISAFALSGPMPESAPTRERVARDAVTEVLGGYGELERTGADGSHARHPGLVVRGFYDVAGLRADADLMMWTHGPTIESVQGAYQRLRASELGGMIEPVWSVAALHRPAEFNRGHLPAFIAGESPRDYLCVYPFVRAYDWYLLPDDERSTMLRDHGMAAAGYADVRANTMSAFALGDYEWVLAFEADELVRIVDLMRDLRATEARRHVREEIPFFTGPRVELADWIEKQPRD